MYSHNVVFNKQCFPLSNSYTTFSDAEEVEFTDHPVAVDQDGSQHNLILTRKPASEELVEESSNSREEVNPESNKEPDTPKSATPSVNQRAPKDI